MTAIDDVLWCVEADSVGATPETLLSIVGTDFQVRSEGWKDLAARPICTNCHARLDYGFQFLEKSVQLSVRLPPVEPKRLSQIAKEAPADLQELVELVAGAEP